MPVEIRPRRAEDLAALAEVLVQVYRVDGYPVEGVGDPEAWLQAAGEVSAWTAVLDHVPIGHVALVRAQASDAAAQVWLRAHPEGELADVAVPVRLFVAPDRRRRGAARGLIEAVCEHAAARGLGLVFEVMRKDQAAICLYERLGCRPLGIIDHCHSGGQVVSAVVYELPAADQRTSQH